MKALIIWSVIYIFDNQFAIINLTAYIAVTAYFLVSLIRTPI